MPSVWTGFSEQSVHDWSIFI